MLKTRVITAIIMMMVLMLALFKLPSHLWAILTFVVAFIAASEWSALVGYTPSEKILFLTLFSLVSWFTYGHMSLLSLAFLVLAALFWLVFVPIHLWSPLTINHKYLLGFIGVVVILPTWLAFILLRGYWPSPFILIGAMALVWIADTSAYFFGKQFGVQKLAPTISPGKTREGAYGALFCVLIYSLLLCGVFELPYYLIIGAIVLTILSIYGDLFESWIKRRANMKDSGTILPGHGGMLDRIDGLTSTLPLVALYFSLIDSPYLK